MNRFFIVLLLTGLAACQQAVDHAITTEELEKHIMYLASDDLAGRYPGTEGDSLAGAYIRDAFESYGLELLADNGYQYIDIVVEVELGENNMLMHGRQTYKIGEEFIPLSFTHNSKIEAQMVFAGYGIVVDHRDFKFDNYTGLDVSGKIVILLEGGPTVKEGEEDYFSGSISHRSKILSAKDRGAIGVILVAGEAFDPDDELLFTNRKEPSAGLPVIRVKQQVVNDFLEGSGQTVNKLESAFSSGSSNGFALSSTVSIETDVVSKIAHTHNVLGLLNGKNGKDGPLLVIGAHYDHLGMGGAGSGSRVPDTVATHYGADDNASGVAAIIEMAGELASQSDLLDCSILFIAFAGEEMGLLGSKYYVNNPLFPLEKVKTMINLDMVGRLKEDNKIGAGGTGSALQFDSLISSVQTNGIQISSSPEGYGPSDHASFYGADIPVLYFSTGAHIDYHTPDDNVEKINYEGIIAVTSIIHDIVLDLASDMEITYQVAGPKQQAARTKYKVTLGIMPDVTTNDNKGLRIEFTTPGRPAQLAGILKGDRIVKMNSLPVANIYDYMTRLQTLEEGQTVVVEVVRNEKTEILLVQL